MWLCCGTGSGPSTKLTDLSSLRDTDLRLTELPADLKLLRLPLEESWQLL
jgi:hypothetical protein